MEAEPRTENPRPPWYMEIFKYLKSHNRIGPGKIELPDCDFLIIKPGRTLRILKPTPTHSGFYELTSDRPESINENFITRWTKRPHSVNNCRCSFRHSSKLGITEEWISTKIDQIKRNLSETEMSDGNIHELEINPVILSCCEDSIAAESTRKVNDSFAANNVRSSDQIKKNSIVKDLETYIDRLLNEILSDTIKFMNDSDSTLRKSRETLNTIDQSDYTIKSVEPLQDTRSSKNSLDISFMFPADNHDQMSIKNNFKHEGYTNQVFVGSDDDPDCLDFYLKKPVSGSTNHDIMECIDSGINSVETIEFPTDSDLNLEESLMQIMDEKFGRSSTFKNFPNQNTQETNSVQEDSNSKNTFDDGEVTQQYTKVNLENKKLSTINNDCINYEMCHTYNFNKKNGTIFKSKSDEEKSNLVENADAPNYLSKPEKKLNSVAFLCEKLTSKFDSNCNNEEEKGNKKLHLGNEAKLKEEKIEMKDYEATWKSCNESSHNDNESLRNSIIYRRNKKPIIVFLHGFGSSAEIFKHQLRYFTQMGYSCIAPDMLGHGMSSAPDKSRDYHFDKLLNDLEIVLQHYAFQPGQKCVLVAHNYGCSFATALACKYSNEIHQLVLISGGGPTPLAPPSKEGTGHCCLRILLSPFLMCGLHRELLYSVKGRQHPYCGLESQDQWPSHMKYVLDGMVWPEGDYLFHRRICTPTLLIHGLRDKKVSLVQECQMERTIVKAYLEAIPMAGHTPMTDTPEQINHMIHCFIDLWKRTNR